MKTNTPGWMSEEQINLVRSALGLNGKRRQSLRNHFVNYGPHPAWENLVEQGFATSHISGPGPTGEDSYLYHATHAGAVRVLQRGETLDPEDFAELRAA